MTDFEPKHPQNVSDAALTYLREVLVEKDAEIARLTDRSPYNRHDVESGPCECGAWHTSRQDLQNKIAEKDTEIARLKRAVEAIRNIKGLDLEKTPQGEDAQKSLIWPSYASGCNEVLRIVNKIFDEELDEDDETANPEDPNHE